MPRPLDGSRLVLHNFATSRAWPVRQQALHIGVNRTGFIVIQRANNVVWVWRGTSSDDLLVGVCQAWSPAVGSAPVYAGRSIGFATSVANLFASFSRVIEIVNAGFKTLVTDCLL